MFKYWLICAILFITMSAYAGEFETAYNTNNPVFLYLYTPDCSYCRIFDSTYKDIMHSNKDYKYVKVNANTQYGRKLMALYSAKYVPYIILASKKNNKSAIVHPECMMNEVCANKVLKDFKS